MKTLPLLLIALLAFLPSPLPAAAVKDREGAVRGDRAAMSKDERWIYNDTDRGFAEAAKTGKPLLVLLRCVPCESCMGIDAGILNAAELQPLLDQFVCVRLINANAIDLSLFQFDYDLSLSTLFFHADRTIYGRFGSWQHQKDSTDASTAGFKAALTSVLALHRSYPANKQALAPKQCPPPPAKIPVEIPSLADKYTRELDWSGKVVQSCVHCHQVGEAFRASYRNQGKPIPPELLFPMPPPETVGISLHPAQPSRVAAVTPDSPAARAGVQTDDDIVALNGTPLISVADFAWALHRSPESGHLILNITRAATSRELLVTLDAGWRQKSEISARVGSWQLRGMALGGLRLEDLQDDERTSRNLPRDGMALLIKHAGEYGLHAAAKRAGFRKDDVLVAIDNLTNRISESGLMGHLITKHLPGETVRATVLRGDSQIELNLPMQ